MIAITDTEHVVRMIFPDSLKKDGGLHPNAFKLRQWPAPKDPEHPSHAGIFINVSGIPLEGSGNVILDSIENGKNKLKNLLAIRRMLSDLAAKTLTTVDTICSQYKSQRSL